MNVVQSKAPQVSVIIPTYNHAQYVSQAIQSVLNQDYDDYEIVVVDDGSKDNTREVVAQFGDRVRYVWQENQGLSAARNTGLKAARGAYIGLLDADDIYEPDFLSTLVSILEANPDAEGVYCGYLFVDHLNNPLPHVEARLIPDGDLYQALVDGNFLVPESMLVRRHCYENVGLFDETLRALEDLDMWLRITSRYRVTGTDRILTRHRILPDSMSTDPARQFNNRLAVIEKHFGPKPISDLGWTDAQRRAYGQMYLTSAVEHLQCHKKDRAFDLFCEMAKAYPVLLVQLNTFYELGCGEQPKGFRGDFATLNIERNSQVLLEMLDRFFSDGQMMAQFKAYRHPAYANAFFALGLLSYGKREFRATRSFLLRAILADVRFGFNRQLVTTFLKSLLGPKFINRLSKAK